MSSRRLVATRVGLVAWLLALSLGAEAQAPAGKMPRIGYLTLRSGPSFLDEAFRQGLRELGYVEGQNIVIEYRWADWNADRAAALAAELVRLKVDVLVSTGGNATALAAKNATRTIPIVFTGGDPVMAGVVASLDRPGGNLTGINLLTTELNGKRLDLLKAAVPAVSRVAVLVNPASPVVGAVLKDLDRVARVLRVKLYVREVRQRSDIDVAFGTIARERAEALLVVSDPMFLGERERLVNLAAKSRLPAVYEFREFAEAGGLMSYGTNVTEMYRHLGTYVDKILKGAKPGDLPIEQATKFELVINLKTAKALGLTIPQSVVFRADRLIE